MPLRRTAAAALALTIVGALAPTAHATPASGPPLTFHKLPRPERSPAAEPAAHDPHSVLVRFKRDASASAKDRVLKKHGARSVNRVGGTDFIKVHTSGAADDVLRELRKDPTVERVSLDYQRRITATPNDPYYTYGDQAYLNTVRMSQAWDRTKGSTSQVIAVVDTGVNTSHLDLVGRTVAGYNALTNGSSALDDNGHGTMVAGIAAANTNNGVGIAGVAWTGRVMPIKVLDADGSGYDSDVAEGIRWAADHGAKVINLSLGGPQDSLVLHEAIKYATTKGVVIVAAAGNSGGNAPEYPAAYPEVLAVGATDKAGSLTDFSTWGDWVDIAAPGFDIVTTYLSQAYSSGSGTSFSAPIVSGVAALIRSLYPTLTNAQVANQLRLTARDAGPRGIDPYYGYGVLDAYRALGGTVGTEFPQVTLGAGEPNDVPARAITLSTSTTGTIAREGDVDWYRYNSDGQKTVEVRATPPAYDWTRAQNFDPVLEVYDKDLRLLGRSDDSSDAAAAEKLAITVETDSYYIAVRNYNGAVDTRSYTLAVAPAPAPMFHPAQSMVAGLSAAASAVGDVTGDGRNDVLFTTNYSSTLNDYKLFVLAQNADGSLASPIRYNTQLQYGDMWGGGLALLDADGDGRRDVALATNSGVQLFQQIDNGVLQSWGVLPGTAGARRIVAADMDSDEDTDLIVGRNSDIQLLTHEADGTFTPSVVATSSTDEVEVGNVDGDARPDIVGYAASTISVYHRTDTGWNRTDHATGSSSSTGGIEVADVTGDGLADITATIAANGFGAYISVLAQNTTGGLDAAVLYSTPDIPQPVEAADINRDGRSDIVTAHGGWGMLSVLPQRSDGKLGAPVTQSIPGASHYNHQGLNLGDINGDGRTDAILADQGSGLTVLTNSAGPALGGKQLWVRDVSPADFSTGTATATTPTVTFQRALDPASVTTSTVRLVHGYTGAAVDAAPTYDEATKTVTLTPVAPLQDNTPYRITVSGVRDLSGGVLEKAFSTTFRTVDLAPSAISGLKATSYYPNVTLSWTRPNITDLDQVIVRMAAGTTPPSSITSGTGVYASIGSSVTVSSLAAGTNYSFQVWVKDRSGKLSPGTVVRVYGTAISISSNTTAINYGSAVTVTGRLTRRDNGTGIADQPVQLYGRRKGTTTWTMLGVPTTNSSGYLAFTHKAAWSLDYKWVYRGSTADPGGPTGYTGVVSGYRAVGVKTVISSTLSKTSFPLGGSVTLSGSVAPSHARWGVYLQRLVNGSWTNVTSKPLSSTSTYSFTIKPTSRGTYYYRVYRPADTDHLAGFSSTRSFKVY